MHIPALLQFLEGLAENNNRPWFLHNKPPYDILREEFEVLVADVGERVRKFDKTLAPFDAKKAVFRIYRDVRFAKDKTPYKTHLGGVIGVRNMTDKTRPVHYFHIDHQGTLLMASGIYAPPPPVLKQIRDYIVAKPAALTKVLKDPSLVKTYGGMSEEGRMTRPPKGYGKDGLHAEQLRNRHFFCETTINIKKRAPKNLAATIAEHFEAAEPLMGWLRVAAKPAQ
jgi:uncharacterized protein (TIGR02453 family)